MMARRPVGSTVAEAKYYLSNAPDTVPLAEMAWVGCLRWTIEENFELGKGEVGLDHYEVTKLRGWYHHITLVLLALAFLKSVQWTWEKKTDRGIGAGDPPASRGRAAAGSLDPDRRHRVVRATASPQGGSSRQPSTTVAA
jgi:SRSO17 transposase